MRKLVPYVGAFWTASDPMTILPTAPARVENLGDPDACAAYWETEFLAEDFVHFRDLARAERPVATLYNATDGLPARSMRFRDVNKRLGYGDELRVVFRADGVTWGFASLWRADETSPFTEAEERLISDLAEPIARVLRRSPLGSSAMPDVQPSDAPGLLVFDEHGTLVSSNEEASTWLNELPPTSGWNDGWRARPGESDRSELRSEIVTVNTVARAIAAGVGRGIAQARVRGRSGRWLVLHGFPMRDADGSASRTAVVIQPARATEVAQLVVKAYDLTPRQEQLTQLIASGLATGEIAYALGLSTHTVRDYVKQVFEKVGVSSRGELVAKIFAEHYGPALEGDLVHAWVDIVH